MGLQGISSTGTSINEYGFQGVISQTDCYEQDREYRSQVDTNRNHSNKQSIQNSYLPRMSAIFKKSIDKASFEKLKKNIQKIAKIVNIEHEELNEPSSATEFIDKFLRDKYKFIHRTNPILCECIKLSDYLSFESYTKLDSYILLHEICKTQDKFKLSKRCVEDFDEEQKADIDYCIDFMRNYLVKMYEYTQLEDLNNYQEIIRQADLIYQKVK